MLPAARKHSKRLAGKAPDSPPKLSEVKKGKGLAQLVATDAVSGRILYDVDEETSWRHPSTTDRPSASVPPDSDVSSLTASAAALKSTLSSTKVKPTSADKRRLSFDDDKKSSSGCMDDDDNFSTSTASTKPEYTALDNLATKLISFPYLKEVIENSCVCKLCHAPVKLSQETFGLATNLCLECCPDDRRRNIHRTLLEADKIEDPAEPPAPEGAKKEQQDSAKRYLINTLMVLGMQQIGAGLTCMEKFFGTLGVKTSFGNGATFKQIQDKLGEAQQSVMKEVLSENLDHAIECAIAAGEQPDEDSRVPLPISDDAGWQKRSVGFSNHDSSSGHLLAICARSKKVLGVRVYSTRCGTCDRGRPVVDDEDQPTQAQVLQPAAGHRCPKNFSGSSKAMESIAAAEVVEEIWNTGKAWVHTMIGDDDATTRSTCTTNWKAYKEAHPGVPQHTYWPFRLSNKNQRVYAKSGRLDWHVRPPAQFLCDPTHRLRVFTGKYYAAAQKEKETDISKADAHRMKRNLGDAVKQYRGASFERFQQAVDAALYHHFNKHEYCDPVWCKYCGDNPTKKNPRNLVRDDNSKKWPNMFKIHKYYTAEEFLRQLWHIWDSQKNESMNRKIAAAAPKDVVFSTTMSLADRIALIIIIDSVGFAAAMRRIITKLTGTTNVRLPAVSQVCFNRLDVTAGWYKQHRQKIETKSKRAQKQIKTIKKCIAADQKAERQGSYYQHGIAVDLKDPPPDETEEETIAVEAAAEATKKRKKRPAPAPEGGPAAKKQKVCPSCGEEGHERKSSKKCRNNPRYKQKTNEQA
jgi:hypothetical protein